MNICSFNSYEIYLAMIEKNIPKKKGVNRRLILGQLVRNWAPKLTNSFRNYEETKQVQAMKLLDDLLSGSEKATLWVKCCFEVSTTVFAKVSGIWATLYA